MQKNLFFTFFVDVKVLPDVAVNTGEIVHELTLYTILSIARSATHERRHAITARRGYCFDIEPIILFRNGSRFPFPERWRK